MKTYRLLIIAVIVLTCSYSTVSFHYFQSSLKDSLFPESQERLNNSGEQVISSLRHSFEEYQNRFTDHRNFNG